MCSDPQAPLLDSYLLRFLGVLSVVIVYTGAQSDNRADSAWFC